MIERMYLHAPIALKGRMGEVEKYGKATPDQDGQYITISAKDPKILILDWLDLHSIQLTLNSAEVSDKLTAMNIISLGRDKGKGANIKRRHYLGIVAPTKPIWLRPLMGYGVRLSIYETLTNKTVDIIGQVFTTGVTNERINADQEWCAVSILYAPDDDRVLSVSAVRFWRNIAISTFESLCRCPKDAQPSGEWLKNNRLNSDALELAPPFEYVMGNYARFIQVAPYLVGYDVLRYVKTIEKFVPVLHPVADIRSMLGVKQNQMVKKKLKKAVEHSGMDAPKDRLQTTRFAMLTARIYTDVFGKKKER